MTEDVATEVVIDDAGSSGRGRVTVLRLSWRQSDPLAVNLVITPQPDHPSLPRGRWVILRDFLRYGMEELTGDGNVKIHPDVARSRVWLELASDGRSFCVSIPCDTVGSFLDATEELVPAGEERSEDALDALIERLLQS